MTQDRHKQKSSYPLRLDSGVREQLEAMARQGNRSLHAEIVARLEASLDSFSGNISSSPQIASVTNSEILALLKAEARELEKKKDELPAFDQKVQNLAVAIASLTDKKIAALSELLGVNLLKG